MTEKKPQIDESIIKIIETFEKNGGKINYFELPKYFNPIPMDKIKEMIDNNIIEITENEEGIFFALKVKTDKKENKEESVTIDINNLRKEFIRQTVENIVKAKRYTITEILNSIFLLYTLDHKEKSKVVKAIWFGLPITCVKCYKVSDKLIYEIVIEDTKIEMGDDEFNKQNVFINKFFNAFGIKLPPLDKNFAPLWQMWIKSIAQEETKLGSLEREEDIIYTCIKNYIENSFITDDISETFKYNYIYVQDGFIYIPNEIIKKIVERETEKTYNYKKLAGFLKNSLIKSEPKKIDEIGMKRFWVFSTDEFKIKKEKVKEDTENKNENQSIENHTISEISTEKEPEKIII